MLQNAAAPTTSSADDSPAGSIEVAALRSSSVADFMIVTDLLMLAAKVEPDRLLGPDGRLRCHVINRESYPFREAAR